MPSNHEDQPNLNRRALITGGAAAIALAVTGCNSSEQASAQPHRTDAPMPNAALKNLRDLGNRHNLHFVDSDGKRVSLNGLQSSIGNRWSTMSFMFAACGDTCPTTGAALASVSRDHPELRHIIISVQPADDFNNGTMRNIMNAQGLVTEGPNRNTFILYPSADGTAENLALREGTWGALELQHELQLMTHGNTAQNHNAAITLFDEKGSVRTQVLEGQRDDIVRVLGQSLPPRNGASR